MAGRELLYTSCAPGSRAPFYAALIITPHCLHANRAILRIVYPQYHPVLLSSESVSPAPSLPLSAASGHKRYNTLDFACKIVCQQGAACPYWKPRAKGLRPSGYPIIFCAKGTHIEKIYFPMSAFFSKMPQHTLLIFAGALQKIQLVPWCAEQNFRVRLHRNFLATLLRQGYSNGDLDLLKRENRNGELTLETKLSLISLLKFDTCVDFENEIAYNIFELVLRGERMDCMNELASIAKAHGGIVETKIAIAHGISKAMLSKLCKEDKIHRVAQGQYIFPDDMQDELLSISKRTEQLIFSHETALFLHGISDRTPFEHTITVPSNYTPSVVTKAACKIYYIKPELFDMGKTLLKTPAGNEVPAYDLERTVCDMIRSRNKLGTETFLAALKMYAASPKKDLNKLNTYAKKMRVSNVLRQYLEVLL